MNDSGKMILITGCSSGLGKAMAQCFRQHGFRVIGISRQQPDFELDRWIACDVTQPGDRINALNTARSEFGRLDVLVNMPGAALRHMGRAFRIGIARGF